MHQRPSGFSILELTIAIGIMMAIAGAMFALLNPSQGIFAAQGEAADLQQRLRVAHDTIAKDLIMAGAGPYLGSQSAVGALNYYFAPVLPFRQGVVGDDGAGRFFADRITLFYVPWTTAESTLSVALSAGGTAGTLNVSPETDCPTSSQKLCGFTAGMAILVVDGDTGNYDTFAVTAVSDAAATVAINRPPNTTATTYPVGSNVVQVIGRTYYLKKDTSAGCSTPVGLHSSGCNDQLMYYDGSANAAVSVVDHVVALTFDYYGDRQPPLLRKPVSDPTAPWTSYGPKPPALGVKPTAYPAGENCAFQIDANGLQVPRLAVLGDGSNPNTLIQLTARELEDGPWCPDDYNASRWDADLLRIRKIGVKIRVEAAVEALRGPAGALFSRAGTSNGGHRWVPDQEVRFQVSPRNLNLDR